MNGQFVHTLPIRADSHLHTPLEPCVWRARRGESALLPTEGSSSIISNGGSFSITCSALQINLPGKRTLFVQPFQNLMVSCQKHTAIEVRISAAPKEKIPDAASQSQEKAHPADCTTFIMSV